MKRFRTVFRGETSNRWQSRAHDYLCTKVKCSKKKLLILQSTQAITVLNDRNICRCAGSLPKTQANNDMFRRTVDPRPANLARSALYELSSPKPPDHRSE